MKYHKYHALGNDYIVISPEHVPKGLPPQEIKTICHRNFGIGSDGILLGPIKSHFCDYKLRIFNPDGTEAEKSGNGLRIFARALYDKEMVSDRLFTVETLGGDVECQVIDKGKSVIVQMGVVRFNSMQIPVIGTEREVINEKMIVKGREFIFCAATIGNPHCVILSERPTQTETEEYGPLIELNALFPNRINVQFMKVIDPHNIQIEIWERGAGYTLASGSSSTAAAAVALKLGLCDEDITVHMPGGELALRFDGNFIATLKGPVTKVSEGIISHEMFSWKRYKH